MAFAFTPQQRHRQPAQSYLEPFLHSVQNARSSNDARALGLLLNPASHVVLRWPDYTALHKELRQDPSRIISLAEQILAEDWPGFFEMVVTYLHYIAVCDPHITSGRPIDLPQKMKHWLTKLTDFLIAANAAFNHNRGAILTDVVRRTHSALVRTCMAVDRNLDPRRHRHSSSDAVLTPLQRSFAIAFGDRGVEKRSIALDLANNLFKLYRFTYEPESASSVHKQLLDSNLLHSLPPGTFSGPSLVKYHYYLGRQHLYLGLLIPCLNSFQAAYELCPPKFVWHRSHILKRLLLVSLILLDNKPTAYLWSLPEAQGLQEIYTPVSAAIRTGDFREFLYSIGTLGKANHWRQTWWKKNNLLWVLQKYCPPLIWRNLIRRVVLITESSVILIQDLCRVAQLSYSKRRPAVTTEQPLFIQPEAKLCQPGNSLYHGGLTPGLRDVESWCLTLFSDGLVKGYIARESEGTRFVLQKEGGFPRIDEWARQVDKEREDERREKEEEEAREKAAAAAQVGGGRVVKLSGVKMIGER